MKEGLWGALIGAVLAAGGTWYSVDQQSQQLEKELRQESVRLERELRSADEDRELAKEQLRTLQEQFEAEQLEVYGDPVAQLEAARRAFYAPDATDEDRQAAVGRLAASLVEASYTDADLVDIDQRLPPGVHQQINGLTDMLEKDPRKVDLNRADLHGHYWQGAVLDHVLLRGADLRAVDFSGASLKSSYLENAHLQCADFSGATMDKTQLGKADLRWSDLRGVDLTTVEGLTNTRLTGVAYDDATKWPDTVDKDELDPPGNYAEPRLCQGEHLESDDVAEEPSSEPSPAA